MNGAERPEFALNQPHHRDARVVVANVNFGCGSSRENAVWALSDYGFEVVIAPSFGDIFHTNCVKNGLLPVRLPEAVVADLLARIVETPDLAIRVDLEAQTVTLPDGSSAFLRNRPVRQILPDQWLRRTRLHLVPSRRNLPLLRTGTDARTIEWSVDYRRVANGEECMPNYVFEIGLPAIECAGPARP